MSVAINALINLAAHAAKGNVRWQTGVVVSLVAVMGALAGSQMGKITDGHYLTLPFSLLMLVVAGLTLKRNHLAGTPLPSPMLPFIPPSYGPASSLWAGWRAFWALAADFWLCRRWFGFSAFRWLKQWQPHWWSWRPWGYRPAPATPCPERYRSRLRAGSSSAAFWGRGGVALAERLKNARTLSMCSMPSCCWRWPCICYLKPMKRKEKHAHLHLPPSTLLFGRA